MTQKATASKTTDSKNNTSPASAVRTEVHSQLSSQEQLLQLHSRYGNRVVQRMYESGVLQAKLKIGPPGDKYEQEADSVAERVMNMPEPNIGRQEDEEEVQSSPLASQISPLVQSQHEEEEETAQAKFLQKQEEEEKVQTQPEEEEETAQTKLLQRQAGEEEEVQKQPEEEEPIQAKGSRETSPAITPSVESGIKSIRGGGQPLSESTRVFFEPRFGADFSGVRVHKDTRAADLSRSINAKAFTLGNDVVFGAGQYAPESSNGKRLMAHELTHVVQQKQFNNITKNLQRKASGATSKSLSFEFSLDLEGETRLHVPEGAGIRVYAEANFSEKDLLYSKPKSFYNIELVEEGIISNTSHGIKIYPVGKGNYGKWENLPEGTYYLRFTKNYPELVEGKVWIDMLSRSGAEALPAKREDKFELETGIPTKELKDVEGILRGQYGIRSEPIDSSFKFGELRGGPTRVQVIDKKAVEREDPRDIKKPYTWYKVQFDEQQFKQLVSNEPPKLDTIAREMYESRQAWIWAGAFTIYVPYELFLKMLNAFEKRDKVKNLSLLKRVTMLRQLHADADIPTDTIIGTEKGKRTLESRPELSNFIQMLKYEPTGIVLKGGELIDIAHFLITLDAYAHANKMITLPEVAPFPFNVVAPKEKLGSSHALASWSGDVGAAAALLVNDYLKETGKQKVCFPIEWANTLIDKNFEKSASDADLLGNLDGLGAHLLLRGQQKVNSIEELIRLYYEGSPGGRSSESETASGGVISNRRRAIAAFLASYGFEDPTNLSRSIGSKNCIYWETNSFAVVWFLRLSDRSLKMATINEPKFYKIIKKLTENASIIMANLFLEKMQEFAKKYGVKTIQKAAYLNISCPPFFQQPLKEVEKKKILSATEIEEKKEAIQPKLNLHKQENEEGEPIQTKAFVDGAIIHQQSLNERDRDQVYG